MTKKLLSSLLAVTLLSTVGNVCAIGASAEDYAITGGEITFRITDDWKYENAKYYIHIWDGREGGSGLYEWQTQNERMTISEDGETATYNVPAGDWNLLILSNSRGAQTYDAVFNQNCIGDTFTTIPDERLSPSDDPIKIFDLVWDNNPDCGRHRRFKASGIGVEGHAYMPGETDLTIFEDYCEYFGPQEDGTFLWDELYKEDYDITWEEAKARMATELGLSNIYKNIKSQLAENYGVKRGLPVTPDMEIPERYSTAFADNVDGITVPSDWDGYYNVYYFEAPDNWINDHSDKKEAGFEIGFYWYSFDIGITNGAWPGEPAKKLSVIDQNGNDIYADRNIYYAFAPTFASMIIWNNGVIDSWNSGTSGLGQESEYYSYETEEIDVFDPMENYISDKIYFEKDETIEGAEIAGCLIYDVEEVYLTSSLVGRPEYITKIAYFDPNTGETSNEPLKDSDGNYVTVPNEFWGYAKVVLNPYYDMDYTYVNEVEAPTEAPTVQATVAPTNSSTEKPTQAPTNATSATQATSNTSNGTVATADKNILAILAPVLLLSVAVTALAQKRKLYR